MLLCRHLNLTSLTSLFKGSDVLTGAQEQLWPNALAAAINDSYVYQLGCTEVCWIQVRIINHRAIAASFCLDVINTILY